DVAIRIANILMAVDLLRDAGAKLESSFLAVLASSTRDHALHILMNLEWSSEGRGNHYLADIVGLMFAAAYLPRTPESDDWLAFASREFIIEAERQFLVDGGNIEGSAAYHRLSSELVCFGTALILGLDEDETAALCRVPSVLNVRPPQARLPLRRHTVG